MRTFKSIRSITIIVVFGILIHWSYFSDCSHAAQAQKAPAATPQTSPAMTPSPSKQVKISLIEGRVVYGTRGMRGIEIILHEYFKNGRVGIAGKQTTNDQGDYKFSIAFDDNIARYKIAAKHPDLSSGDNFSPREREFPPAMGLTKIDFAYSGPLPDLVPVSINVMTAVIENQGNLAAGPFQVTFTYKCSTGSTSESCFPMGVPVPVSLNRLDPGQRKQIGAPPHTCHCRNTYTYGFGQTSTTEYDKPATSVSAVSVDIKDVVVESNENNNTMQ